MAAATKPGEIGSIGLIGPILEVSSCVYLPLSVTFITSTVAMISPALFETSYQPGKPRQRTVPSFPVVKVTVVFQRRPIHSSSTSPRLRIVQSRFQEAASGFQCRPYQNPHSKNPV